MPAVSLNTDQILSAGAQEATGALQRLLQVSVRADAVLDLDDTQLIASHGPTAVVIVFQATGGVSGTLAVVLDDDVALWLASLMSASIAAEGTIGAGVLCMLAEFGNIVASAFLNGAARIAGRTCLPSVPMVLHGATHQGVAAAVPPGTPLRVVKLRAQERCISVLFTG